MGLIFSMNSSKLYKILAHCSFLVLISLFIILFLWPSEVKKIIKLLLDETPPEIIATPSP